MKHYKQRWQLKNNAKEKLSGQYSEAVLLTMVYGLLMLAATLLDTFVMCSFSGEGDLLLKMLFAETTPVGYLVSTAVSLPLSATSTANSPPCRVTVRDLIR